MKKIKLLAPILGVTALVPAVAQTLTSCGVSETNIIPTDLLEIDDYTLKGLKDEADISKYSTLVIPEGIKYIDDNAFANVFASGSVWSNIQNVVFPKSLRGIRSGAFAGCTALRVLDFTEFTADEVYHLEVEDASTNAEKIPAFQNTSMSGQVYTSDSLSDESKEDLSDRLNVGGLSYIWFADEVTDKVSADPAWKAQTEESGVAHYKLGLNVNLPDNTYLAAFVNRTGGTLGVDIETEGELLEFTDKIADFRVCLQNQTKTGDYCDFDVTVAAIKIEEDTANANAITGGEILWKQTINGFKLTNTQPEIVTVRELIVNPESTVLAPDSATTVETVTYPSNAEDPSVIWTSSNKEVAVIDSNGKIVSRSSGKTTITATTKDTGNVSASFVLTVGELIDKADPHLEYYPYPVYLYKDISSMEFNTTDEYTFFVDTTKFESEYFENHDHMRLAFNDTPGQPTKYGWKFDTVKISYITALGTTTNWVENKDYEIDTYPGDTITFSNKTLTYGDTLCITIKFASIGDEAEHLELSLEYRD